MGVSVNHEISLTVRAPRWESGYPEVSEPTTHGVLVPMPSFRRYALIAAPVALLRRGACAHTMKVTLTGRGRRGARLRFDSETIPKGASRIEVVRLNVRKRQRGAFAHARSVVVSSSHHWSRGKATNDWCFLITSNLVAVGNANVSGRVGRNPFTTRTPRECDVATLGPNVTATNCDFPCANLSGADLRGANFTGSVFD